MSDTFTQVGNKRQIMPPGYVMLYTDSHFVWIHIETGAESSIHWDRWAVYRGAWARYNKENK